MKKKKKKKKKLITLIIYLYNSDLLCICLKYILLWELRRPNPSDKQDKLALPIIFFRI